MPGEEAQLLEGQPQRTVFGMAFDVGVELRLGGFATNGINMTKLESYMVGGRFAQAQFYADVEGHPEDRPLRLAFEELAFFSRHFRILGVYPANPFRRDPSQAIGDD